MNLSIKQFSAALAAASVLAIVLTASFTGKVPPMSLRISHPAPDIEFNLGTPAPPPSKAPVHRKHHNSKAAHKRGL